MKILILSQWYIPENVSGKINSIGKEFINLGHSIKCFTGFPNYPNGKIFDNYNLSFWKKENINGVEVIRFPSFIDHSKNKIKRILNYFSLSLAVTFLGIFHLGKPDVIFLYDSLLSMGLPAIIFSKIKGIPLIFEIQDMYPETLRATGMINSNRILSIVNSFSNILYRNSKYISVISTGFKKNLIEKGVSNDKIRVIPNWAEDYFHPSAPDEKLIKKYHLGGTFKVIYAGNIGIAQELENLIKTAELLKNYDNIRIILIGDGNDKKKLQHLVREKKLENVVFIPKVPMQEISSYLALADVLLIHLKNDPIFEITIPSKTITYLAVGKPIICVADGEVNELLRKAKVGKSCEPGNIEMLKAAIHNFSKMNASDLKLLGENGRKFFETHFTKKIIMNKYESILLKV